MGRVSLAIRLYRYRRTLQELQQVLARSGDTQWSDILRRVIIEYDSMSLRRGDYTRMLHHMLRTEKALTGGMGSLNDISIPDDRLRAKFDAVKLQLHNRVNDVLSEPSINHGLNAQ